MTYVMLFCQTKTARTHIPYNKFKNAYFGIYFEQAYIRRFSKASSLYFETKSYVSKIATYAHARRGE